VIQVSQPNVLVGLFARLCVCVCVCFQKTGTHTYHVEWQKGETTKEV